MTGGSSPLARGLLKPIFDTVTDNRIIPARAGFTSRPNRGSLSPPDHPRSRGVYAGSPISCASTEGSSPLARGLPGKWIDGFGEWRIIPARAGFTSAHG